MQEIRVYKINRERGAALILTFIIFITLSAIAFAFLTMINYEIRSVGTALRNMQVFYIAEAGRAKARWALTVGEQTVPWSESDTELGHGTFTVSATNDDPPGDGTVTTITSSGYIPGDDNPIAQRQVVEADISIGSGELTNLSLDADISASSQKLPQNRDDYANDGNDNTKWKADDKNDAWLKLDFGSSITFDRVIYTGSNINSCGIWYSDSPDSGYTLAATAIGSSGTVNFDSVEARYLRFDMEVDATRTADVNELESYDSNEEVSATLGQGEFSTSW